MIITLPRQSERQTQDLEEKNDAMAILQNNETREEGLILLSNFCHSIDAQDSQILFPILQKYLFSEKEELRKSSLIIFGNLKNLSETNEIAYTTLMEFYSTFQDILNDSTMKYIVLVFINVLNERKFIFQSLEFLSLCLEKNELVNYLFNDFVDDESIERLLEKKIIHQIINSFIKKTQVNCLESTQDYFLLKNVENFLKVEKSRNLLIEMNGYHSLIKFPKLKQIYQIFNSKTGRNILSNPRMFFKFSKRNFLDIIHVESISQVDDLLNFVNWGKLNSISVKNGEMKHSFSKFQFLDLNYDMEENFCAISVNSKIHLLQLNQDSRVFHVEHDTNKPVCLAILDNVLNMIYTSRTSTYVESFDLETLEHIKRNALFTRDTRPSKIIKRGKFIAICGDETMIFKWSTKDQRYEMLKTLEKASHISINSSCDLICLVSKSLEGDTDIYKFYSVGHKSDLLFEYLSYSNVSFGNFSNTNPDLFILRDQWSFQLFLLKDGLKMEDCVVQTVINNSYSEFCFSKNDEFLYSTEPDGIVEFQLLKGKFFGQQIKETKLEDVHYRFHK
jgi:hypothetical protein